MERKRTVRTGVREGYDLWAEIYDSTPNPVVFMDARHTFELLSPRRNERILDAGCGTGRNLHKLAGAGARACGVDFSLGMLKVARRALPRVPLVQADLQRDLPFYRGSFDAVLCTLIGEHLENLLRTFTELHQALAPGGRFVFSVYHPDLAAAGKEANFELGGAEFRLGAIPYTFSDYLSLIEEAGFLELRSYEFEGDEHLARSVPNAAGLVGKKVILAVQGLRQ